MYDKKELRQKQFVENLLSLRDLIEDALLNLFSNEIGFEGDERILNLEVKILSLWIITLAIPNNRYRDLIHMSFCKDVGFSEEQKDFFLKDVDKRYKTYFESYNMWIKTKNGSFIGTAIIETIINGNDGYSIMTDGMPLVGTMDSLKTFIVFSESLKSALEMIKELKDKYVIEF